MTPTATTTDADILRRIRQEILGRQTFLVTSHAKPDGDSIGSQVALAAALRSLGKTVRIVNCDPPQPALRSFPGVADIEIASRVEERYDAVIAVECPDLSRTGVSGLEPNFIINIDHHPGNTSYGAVNWFDRGAAACGEMVFDVVASLGVPLSPEMATGLYVAILTDTGSFHYSNITPRTFDVCRQLIEAGANPVAIARTVFDDNSVGRIRLSSAVLGSMDVDESGRLATMLMTPEMERVTGGRYDDTEGLINVPLTVRGIQAVVLFKEAEPGAYRVSFRSKGAVDVSEVAKQFGGGGHKNAAGCTVPGDLPSVRQQVVPRALEAIDRAMQASS
jgi:phosphoesterase RecJ-like protein